MGPVNIEFINNGDCVYGEIYPAVSQKPAATFLFIPGWPGLPEVWLDLGPALSDQNINFCWFNPRGLHPSGGVMTHAGTLLDTTAALRWLKQPDIQKRFKVEPASIVIGGYSFGGGMAMAYAALDSSIRRVISIAGLDFGELAKELRQNTAFAENIRRWRASTRAPGGPARYDEESTFKELMDYHIIYGLRENAAHLADRSILVIGGWDDEGASIDNYQLPFYRSLKKAGASDVTFLVYHTDHTFANVRQQLAADIASWILQGK